MKSWIDRLLLRPSARARDVYMGLGGLLLILAVIAFAGASFTFDAARRELLRPLGAVLGLVGAACWARGSVRPKEDEPSG